MHRDDKTNAVTSQFSRLEMGADLRAQVADGRSTALPALCSADSPAAREGAAAPISFDIDPCHELGDPRQRPHSTPPRPQSLKPLRSPPLIGLPGPSGAETHGAQAHAQLPPPLSAMALGRSRVCDSSADAAAAPAHGKSIFTMGRSEDMYASRGIEGMASKHDRMDAAPAAMAVVSTASDTLTMAPAPTMPSAMPSTLHMPVSMSGMEAPHELGARPRLGAGENGTLAAGGMGPAPLLSRPLILATPPGRPQSSASPLTQGRRQSAPIAAYNSTTAGASEGCGVAPVVATDGLDAERMSGSGGVDNEVIDMMSPQPRVRVLAQVAAPSPNNTVQSPRSPQPIGCSPRSRFRSLVPLPRAGGDVDARRAVLPHATATLDGVPGAK